MGASNGVSSGEGRYTEHDLASLTAVVRGGAQTRPSGRLFVLQSASDRTANPGAQV